MDLKCFRNKEYINDLSKIAQFLKVVGEENRLKIICLLEKDEKCVCDIWQYLKLSQNLVSHHLKILKDFGLISSRQSGLKIFYSLNIKNIKKYSTLFNKFINF